MHTVYLSEQTFRWLKRRASEQETTPDQEADKLLREQLVPQHAYIEIVPKLGGPRAVIKGTNIPVSLIIGYL